MFFPDRITSIQPGDRVLEIGPGATPHPRSDVFLERRFGSDEEFIAQSGHVGLLKTDKEVVYYDGDRFPFEDKAFDYVICSHVLEHVDDVPLFLNEIMRVGKKGYLEFPTIYYDYLHNIEEHLNMLLHDNGTIYWCKKQETPIPGLKPFTDFFRAVQVKGYRMQQEINSAWHQGFEWESVIRSQHVDDWKKLCYAPQRLEEVLVPPRKVTTEKTGIKYSLGLLRRSVMIKFRSKK